MDRAAFASCLRNAVATSLHEFEADHPSERVYAFAIILGQVGEYLAYAVASEEALLRTAAEYEQRGYRYQGHDWGHHA